MEIHRGRMLQQESLYSKTFKTAAVDATKLKQRPNNKYLGQLYGLYKQATVGDNISNRPGMFDIAGQAKWDAWTLKKGLSKEEAMDAYVNLVEELKVIYGID
ncbi:acyl-CoA-binding protein homolog 1-like isoform X2 [Epinephelus fuscoguttatus]|uniref:acyl-CoA-binding protein homolog 1-like isoform X2 n=1 Tax=Epinephelus fuscoguttatus TaxID=293821 RepID=UPI0020D1662E|nr:acyl-CoA-binding protein homolog 1-like isoform X2 [Epinephelus fuscoguttatus]